LKITPHIIAPGPGPEIRHIYTILEGFPEATSKYVVRESVANCNVMHTNLQLKISQIRVPYTCSINNNSFVILVGALMLTRANAS
jgi:hypothetical protein